MTSWGDNRSNGGGGQSEEDSLPKGIGDVPQLPQVLQLPQPSEEDSLPKGIGDFDDLLSVAVLVRSEEDSLPKGIGDSHREGQATFPWLSPKRTRCRKALVTL